MLRVMRRRVCGVLSVLRAPRRSLKRVSSSFFETHEALVANDIAKLEALFQQSLADRNLSLVCFIFNKVGVTARIKDERLRRFKRDILIPEVTALFEEMASSGHTPSAGGVLHLNLLGALRVVSGLQNVSSGQEHERALIKAVNKALQLSVPLIRPTSKGMLSAQDMALLTYGFKSMSSEQAVVRQLAALVAGLMRAHGAPSAKGAAVNIGLLLTGLQGLSGCAEVLRLVECVTWVLESSVASCEGHAFALAVYGLRSLSSDHAAVQALLAALVRATARWRSGGLPPADGHQLAMVWSGLRRLSSADRSTLELMYTASAMSADWKGKATIAQAVMVVEALRHKRCDCPQVLGAVKHVTRLLASCAPSVVSARQCASIVASLESLGECPEVLLLVGGTYV